MNRAKSRLFQRRAIVKEPLPLARSSHYHVPFRNYYTKAFSILVALLLVNIITILRWVGSNAVVGVTDIAVKDTTRLKLWKAAVELENLSTRFYMYDNPNITVKPGGGNWYGSRPHIWKRYGIDIVNDEQIFAKLEKSPLRTRNPDEAELFIPPIPFGRILCFRKKKVAIAMQTAMNALLDDVLFQKYQGHKHVFINTNFIFFRSQQSQYTPMKDYYKHIYNSTVIQSSDHSAVYNELHHTDVNWGEFQHYKELVKPLTRRSASIGLGGVNTDVKLTLATLEKFHDSSNFIFYHSRSEPYFNNSTIFRHAPITNITSTGFPKSSIGWGLESNKYQFEHARSKFCLVIRGDTPHSHALWRSIRAGCIPVIASDLLPIYSPMFKATLNMTDFAVVVREQEFMKDLENELLQLIKMSEADIEVKIKHLAFAQRVIFTDHPQSLIVPALLQEAIFATEVQW